ncbi:MAG: S8 family serine peptidase, partial [Deltaproteobacteria bacterium]|nr:S8 family serine peptidase [Deltaproteobacteria bacterium]
MINLPRFFLIVCLLGSTLGVFSGAALAAPPFQLAHQWRHGHDVVYLQNLTQVAVFGSPDEQHLRASLAGSRLKVTAVKQARGVHIVTIKTTKRSAPTLSDLSVVATRLRRVKGVSGTGPVYFDGPSLTVSTGRIWIYLPTGTRKEATQKHLQRLGLKLVEQIEAERTIAIGVPTKSFSIDALIQTLIEKGEDAVPELMRKVKPYYLPSEPYFSKQWYLRNTGINVTRAQNQKSIDAVKYADARLEKAWDETTGTHGLLVGVIDSGVDCSHPELTGKCHDGYNAVTNKNDPTPPTKTQDTGGGHGTSVAGIISAPEDGKGMVGVCPSCDIVPIRLIETGRFLTDVMMLRAFKHAVDAGAMVINNSWGPSLGGEYHIPISQGELQGIKYAGQGRQGKGVLVVYAAGNENADTKYLGHEQTGETNVVVVAASNHMDRRSVYSNFGV